MKSFVTYEKRMYVILDSLTYISRTNRKLMKEPYLSSVLKDLSNIELTLDKNNQSLLLEAIEELSKLDGYIKDKLDGFPMIMLRSESLSSTQIEHYNDSNRNIAAAQIVQVKGKEANIIKNNLESLMTFLDEDVEVSKQTIVNLNRKILNDDSANIRDVVNWIGSRTSIPHTADFVPPHPDYINENIDHFISFCRRDDINPLIQAAFAYAYFETIHPFADGNGRVGRILVQMLLKEKNYLENLHIPFSIGLLKNPTNHIKALTDFRDGNYQSIIKLFLENALTVTPLIYNSLNEIIKIKENWQYKLKARKDALAWKILDELIYQPVINVSYIKTKYNVNDQTVRNNFLLLEEAGIINKIGSNKRNIIYEAKEILEVLDNLTHKQWFKIKY